MGRTDALPELPAVEGSGETYRLNKLPHIFAAMFFVDRLTLDAPKRTKEGFMAVRARAARTGVYDYLGRELDPEGKHFRADQLVKVYRPESEVFSRDAVHSFMLKPITDDHPSAPVTADNWKHHARGVAAGAMRDGDFLAFDLVLMDARAIEAVDDGKRELSNGYTSELVIAEDGKHPDGTACDAWQTTIRGNHIALVKAGRAGPECRIGDAALCSSIDVEVLSNLLADGQTYRAAPTGDNFHGNRQKPSGAGNMNTVIIDSIPFEMNDQAIAAVRKLQGQLSDAQTKLATVETSVAALTTEAATKDAKITTLEKQLEDSKLSPAALRDAAASFARVVEKGKTLGVNVTDEMDEAAIIKTAVLAKLGDAAKDWNDAQFAASFASLTVDAKGQSIDPVRQILKDGATQITDTRAIRDAARTQRYARND